MRGIQEIEVEAEIPAGAVYRHEHLLATDCRSFDLVVRAGNGFRLRNIMVGREIRTFGDPIPLTAFSADASGRPKHAGGKAGELLRLTFVNETSAVQRLSFLLFIEAAP